MKPLNSIFVVACLSLVSIKPSSASPAYLGLPQYVSAEDCEQDCATVSLNNPVCASNGKTYPNTHILPCVSQCHDSHISMVHWGECKPPPIPNAPFPSNPGSFKESVEDNCDGPCAIPLIYSPVCASDGRTYSSHYLMECRRKCDPGIHVVHPGTCRPTESTYDR